MNFNFNQSLFRADGILGLGFPSLSVFHADPVFTTLVNQERVQESVFGLSLAGKNPALVVGGRDSNRYTGDFTYLKVDKAFVRISRGVPCSHSNTGIIQGYWQTMFEGITLTVESYPSYHVPVSKKAVFIDSGTTHVLGNEDSIFGFYKNITGSVRFGNSWGCTFVTELAVRVAS
jgi:hypothetical protein